MAEHVHVKLPSTECRWTFVIHGGGFNSWNSINKTDFGVHRAPNTAGAVLRCVPPKALEAISLEALLRLVEVACHSMDHQKASEVLSRPLVCLAWFYLL